MKNFDEHKKLLAQITELEKNSVNYFDVEKEFFLIDSDNLAEIKTKLYGYAIQATGIYEDDDLTPEVAANLDGRGCYVYVEARGGKITIKQDLNGSWEIYLFRHGDYFALSNSFFRLLDHVKFKYPLTVNRDYCNYFLTNELCSHSYSATAVNEIRLVERNAIVHIDAATKSLELELIDYREHTVAPDSEEGLAILDSWIDFWSGVLRGVAQHTKFLAADLSGGIDSRISFLVLLKSGIDFSKIRICSLKFKQADFDIAQKISEHYGAELNLPFPDSQFLNYSLADNFNVNTHYRDTFKKFADSTPMKKNSDKIYSCGGYGGETIRLYWHKAPSKFIKGQCGRTRPYSTVLSREMSSSIKKMIGSAFRNICAKYNIEDLNSQDIPQYFYQETRCRHHFGKAMLGKYIKNEITLSPLIDPKLRTLRLCSPECSDLNLLIALIFTRYEPQLLTFPFDGDRFIAPATIAYAQKINERFPRRVTADKVSRDEFHLQPRDLQVEKILAEGKNNNALPFAINRDCLKAAFDSTGAYGLFSAYFDDEIYHHANYVYENENDSRQVYAVFSIAKVLESVKVSNGNRPMHSLQNFLAQDFYEINSFAQTLYKFKNFFTARMLVRLDKEINADNLKLLSCSDSKAKFSKPAWWQDKGICHAIDSYVGQLMIVVKVAVDGKAQVRISSAFDCWIDYTKLIVNGKTIFDTLTPAHGNKPYIYDMDVKAGDEIKIQTEWQPHRSDA